MARPRKYPEELLERGVQLVFESGRPIAHVAKDLGVTSEVLRKRVRQTEADNGSRPDLPSSAEREDIRKNPVTRPEASGSRRRPTRTSLATGTGGGGLARAG